MITVPAVVGRTAIPYVRPAVSVIGVGSAAKCSPLLPAVCAVTSGSNDTVASVTGLVSGSAYRIRRTRSPAATPAIDTPMPEICILNGATNVFAYSSGVVLSPNAVRLAIERNGNGGMPSIQPGVQASLVRRHQRNCT